MRDAVKAFKVLSDETRLRILNLLLERESCVCEVMQALNVSQSTASRSLSALYGAGFLKLRREGLWSFYSIDKDRPQDFCSQLIDAAEKALENNNVAESDRQRLRKTEPVERAKASRKSRIKVLTADDSLSPQHQ